MALLSSNQPFEKDSDTCVYLKASNPCGEADIMPQESYLFRQKLGLRLNLGALWSAAHGRGLLSIAGQSHVDS